MLTNDLIVKCYREKKKKKIGVLKQNRYRNTGPAWRQGNGNMMTSYLILMDATKTLSIKECMPDFLR